MAMIGRALRRLTLAQSVSAGEATGKNASAVFCRHVQATAAPQQRISSLGNTPPQNFSSSSSSNNGNNEGGFRSSNYGRELVFPLQGTLNKTILLGYVGADPKVKILRNGRTVTLFPLATKGKSVARDAEQTPDSERSKESSIRPDGRLNRGRHEDVNQWHRIAVYQDHFGQIAMGQLRKGSKVYVEGLMEIRQYKDGTGFWKTVRETAIRSPAGMILPLEAYSGSRQRKGVPEATSVKGDEDDVMPPEEDSQPPEEGSPTPVRYVV